jgi:hypothetical protein
MGAFWVGWAVYVLVVGGIWAAVCWFVPISGDVALAVGMLLGVLAPFAGIRAWEEWG